MLAWSPGTNGPVEADVVVLPEFEDEAAFRAWLPQVRGKFVLVSVPQITCRPDATWQEFTTQESFEKLQAERRAAQRAWSQRSGATGRTVWHLAVILEEAGTRGHLSSGR